MWCWRKIEKIENSVPNISVAHSNINTNHQEETAYHDSLVLIIVIYYQMMIK